MSQLPFPDTGVVALAAPGPRLDDVIGMSAPLVTRGSVTSVFALMEMAALSIPARTQDGQVLGRLYEADSSAHFSQSNPEPALQSLKCAAAGGVAAATPLPTATAAHAFSVLLSHLRRPDNREDTVPTPCRALRA